MEKKRAAQLVKNTFENRYNKEGFSQFITDLLNEVDQSNSFSYSESGIPILYRGSIKQYERLAQYKDPAGDTLDVLAVNLKRETSPKRARTMQRNFVGWYLKSQSYSTDNALVAFYHEDMEDWRFSYVKIGYRPEPDESGKISIEEELTPARRFSFLVGKNEPSHTAQTQIVPILGDDKDNPTLSVVEKAFDVETVTDEFFRKYRDLFHELKDSLNNLVEEDPKIKNEFGRKKIKTDDFAKKLLGQIVFLYFLQKKGWLGVERGKEWGSGSKSFLRERFNRREDKNFFNDILEPLFYTALRHDRREIDDYFSQFDCKIPFLNGGLFDTINDYDWVNTDIRLPDELFSNKREAKQDDGILDVFDRYNFTVKEDEPLEREVAIDPEMLGKVFENLLGGKDRKSRGTYYTPREIVHYMCQESLINYLDTEFADSIERDDFKKLIKHSEASFESADIEETGNETEMLPQSIRQNALSIDKKLSLIRVCDPAVGSGAFVVGMMNEVVGVRDALTPCFRDGDTEGRNPYNFKRDAIQNCLYGVDIDSGAVEIAKLRLWLSLVVDEKDRKKIRPLPNLDYKIIQGDSLLKVDGQDLYNFEFQELKEKQRLYFNKENPSKKRDLKRRIDELMSRHIGEDFDLTIHFPEIFGGASGERGKGFDIVIGNPPYVQLQKMKGDPVREEYRKLYEVYVGSGDIYCLFYERGMGIARNKGVLCYISSNTWMRSDYGKKLRRFFLRWNPSILINLGAKVFEAATVDTNILFVQKKNPNEDSLRGLELDKRMRTNIGDEVNRKSVKIPSLTDGPWFIGSEVEMNLKQKIEHIGKPLKEWDISIYRGILTGYNKAFIIDNGTKEALIKQDPKSSEIIKPLLRGKDISRYKAEWKGLWLINTHNGYGKALPVNIQNYEAVKKYLEKFYPELEKRQDKGATPYNLRNCAYYEEFEKEKIVWKIVGSVLRFAYCADSVFSLNSTCIATGEKMRFLTALLNSRLARYKLFSSAPKTGTGDLMVGVQAIAPLFLPHPSKKQEEEIVEVFRAILKAKTPNPYADVSDMESKIDHLTYELYDLTQMEVSFLEKANFLR